MDESKRTVFISEGPDWVEIDSDNNEISRVRKPTFETGHLVKPFAVYAGTLKRTIAKHPASTEVGIMHISGGKLCILKNGEHIHLDAKMNEDFEFVLPPKILEEAPEEAADSDRQAIAGMLKNVEEIVKELDKDAVVGADLIAEMIAAEQINIKPEDAKVEIFHGNGTHSDNGCMVIYDDSKILKLQKSEILKRVKSKDVPGFIVTPDQLVKLLFLALQSREALMMPKASMPLRLGVAHELFEVLEEIGII